MTKQSVWLNEIKLNEIKLFEVKSFEVKCARLRTFKANRPSGKVGKVPRKAEGNVINIVISVSLLTIRG